MSHIAIFFLFILAPFISYATEVTPSDFVGLTEEEVIETLGTPTGEIDLGDQKKLMFARGDITLKKGKVISSSLISEEEYAQQLDQQEKAQQRQKAYQEKLSRENRQVGEKIRDDKRKDPDFIDLPIRTRIVYWRNFQKKYPEVDLEPEFTQLVERYKKIKEKAPAAPSSATEKKKSYNNSSSSNPSPQAFYHRGKYLYPTIYSSETHCFPRRPVLSIGYRSDKYAITYRSH